MTKKQNYNQTKPYEEGWNEAKSHYLLDAILSLTKLHVLDENSPFLNDIFIPHNGYCFIKINKDYRANIFIRKFNKFKKEDWSFVFATLAIYLGLGLYKKYDEKNLFIKQGLMLFAIYYVKNIIGFNKLPSYWEIFSELETLINFKNESSVIEQLMREPFLLEKTKTISFLNDYKLNAFRFINENFSFYFNWQSNKSFTDVFIDNLILQAQKTITLRSSNNLTKEELELRNTPGYKAKKWFEYHYPLLASLSSSFKIIEDIQICKRLDIQIAAVSAINKTIYINPLAQLNEMGARFVIAHEILHIALDHARRRAGRDPLIWNFACDFVINRWLIEMNVGIPPEGLFFDKTLAGKSADEIYLMIASDVRLKKKMMTLKNIRAGENNDKRNCDILDQDPSYFSEFADACKEALLRGLFAHQFAGRGDLPSDLIEEIKVINQPAIPWQVELAQWISQCFPLDENKRTYSRPSRRQSSTPDIPRPSYIKPTYEKNTRTYGVIMDTSASMDKQLLGKCLGAIASYSAAQEVKEVRLIFCDAQPYDEGFIPVEMLTHKVKVKGRGGTVLQQAADYLQNCQDFPNEAPILILTDGFFEKTLKIEREHAFLVPNKTYMPFSAKNVFEFK